ncbi:DUF58 domain-containing protein [Candidatus Woesearchaeota archaeon]|nr:MAG: DUF58 domain-containing protein [Candidatus Woesearchaeota archaeon]
MVDLSFLKALDRLHLILKKRVHADLQGGHEASEFGQGLVFQDYKAYVPGDDFRHIDWNIYARTNKFFIKRFEEERNLSVHILLDRSASMDYGEKITKFEYAARVSLGFIYMAMRNNEKFTLATFTDKAEALRPGRGASQLMNTFNVLQKLKVKGQSNFRMAMDSYKKQIRSRSLIIIVSDFLYNLDEVRETLLRYRKSEVYIVQVLDPVERHLSLQGDFVLEDSETNQRLRTYVSRRLQQTYQHKLSEHIMRLKDLCEETDAAFVSVTTDTPIFETFYHILR